MSKKPVLYCQCYMERKTRTGTSTMVSYIPEKYVKFGVVKLKDDYGHWTDGWVIKSAGEPTEMPEDPKKAIREHRKRTGDSLPKKPPEPEKEG